MVILESKDVALRWGELAPKVQEALDHGLGENSAHDLFLECMSGNAQCWVHEDLVAITRLCRYPQYTQLQLVTVTGPLLSGHWQELLNFLEEFAKEMGCRNLSIWGRSGWKRILKDYQEPYAVLIKEL